MEKLSETFAREALLEIHQGEQAGEQFVVNAAAARLHRVRPSDAGLLERYGDVAVIWIYGRWVRLGSAPGRLCGIDIADAIKASASTRAIYFRISSEGGSTAALAQALGALHSYRGRSIAVIDDRAYSAAAEFAIECDRVIARRSAQMMFHQQTAAFCGNADQLFAFVNDMRRQDRIALQRIIKRAGRGADRLAIERAFNEERYLGASEALSLGLVDAIAPDLLEIHDLIASSKEDKHHE